MMSTPSRESGLQSPCSIRTSVISRTPLKSAPFFETDQPVILEEQKQPPVILDDEQTNFRNNKEETLTNDGPKYEIRQGSIQNIFYVGYSGQVVWKKEGLYSYYIITEGQAAIMIRASSDILMEKLLTFCFKHWKMEGEYEMTLCGDILDQKRSLLEFSDQATFILIPVGAIPEHVRKHKGKLWCCLDCDFKSFQSLKVMERKHQKHKILFDVELKKCRQWGRSDNDRIQGKGKELSLFGHPICKKQYVLPSFLREDLKPVCSERFSLKKEGYQRECKMCQEGIIYCQLCNNSKCEDHMNVVGYTKICKGCSNQNSNKETAEEEKRIEQSEKKITLKKERPASKKQCSSVTTLEIEMNNNDLESKIEMRRSDRNKNKLVKYQQDNDPELDSSIDISFSSDNSDFEPKSDAESSYECELEETHAKKKMSTKNTKSNAKFLFLKSMPDLTDDESEDEDETRQFRRDNREVLRTRINELIENPPVRYDIWQPDDEDMGYIEKFLIAPTLTESGKYTHKGYLMPKKVRDMQKLGKLPKGEDRNLRKYWSDTGENFKNAFISLMCEYQNDVYKNNPDFDENKPHLKLVTVRSGENEEKEIRKLSVSQFFAFKTSDHLQLKDISKLIEENFESPSVKLHIVKSYDQFAESIENYLGTSECEAKFRATRTTAEKTLDAVDFQRKTNKRINEEIMRIKNLRKQIISGKFHGRMKGMVSLFSLVFGFYFTFF